MLSLCMIVKNESHCLAACLDSAWGIADEIVIVDTGSEDNTVEIARHYTENIYFFEWINDFAAARNFSFSKATGDFIMWLDADDIITEENRLKLINLKQSLNEDVDCVFMDYHTFCREKNESIFSNIRIVRREAGLKWTGAIHETLDLGKHCLKVNIFITHTWTPNKDSSQRNYSILLPIIESGHASPKELYYYGMYLYNKDRLDEALEVFKKLIGSNLIGDMHTIFLNMHNIYRLRGDYQSAKSILEDNWAQMSDKAEYYSLLGVFYQECCSDYDTAINLYETALNCKGTFFNGQFPGIRYEEYYYFIPNFLLAKAYIEKRECDKAFFYISEALKYRDDSLAKQLRSKLERYEGLKKELVYAN